MPFALAGDWPDTIAPHLTDLPDRLAPAPAWPLPWADARLAPLNRGLWLTVADGRLFELGGGQPPDLGGEPSATLPPGGLRPAVCSEPVYVTAAGEVGRWSPTPGWRPIWSAGVPGRALDALGLPDGKLLMSSSAWPGGMRLLDERRVALAWSLASTASRMLAVEDVALAWKEGRVRAIALAEGRLLWHRDGVVSVAAMSATAAWIVDGSGDLVELAVADGAEQARTALPGGLASFALAPGGILHVVGRPLEAAVLDLGDGMRPLARREYPELPIHGIPQAVAVTPDARLLVVTADSLLELRPAYDGSVHGVWRTEHLIVDAAAAGARMAVLARDDSGRRFLTVLA